MGRLVCLADDEAARALANQIYILRNIYYYNKYLSMNFILGNGRFRRSRPDSAEGACPIVAE